MSWTLNNIPKWALKRALNSFRNEIVETLADWVLLIAYILLYKFQYETMQSVISLVWIEFLHLLKSRRMEKKKEKWGFLLARLAHCKEAFGKDLLNFIFKKIFKKIAILSSSQATTR